jgi:hypothetical protein
VEYKVQHSIRKTIKLFSDYTIIQSYRPIKNPSGGGAYIIAGCFLCLLIFQKVLLLFFNGIGLGDVKIALKAGKHNKS